MRWNAYHKIAFFKDTDLSETEKLNQAHLDQSFGDTSATLPKALTRPDHWAKADLDWDDYDQAYKEWLETAYPDLYKERYGE